MISKKIDINCDLGEGSTKDDCEKDACLMIYLTRCNVACGQHAGNEKTMQLTLKNAAANAILSGAHPSYPDRAHFGRVSMHMSRDALLDCFIRQIDNLQEIAAKQGLMLSHIKLHGALYNDTEKHALQAQWIAECIKARYSHLAVLGLAGGCLETACQENGLEFIREGFMDRRYQRSGQLTPRSQKGAVIEDREKAIEQAVNLAVSKPITDDEGGLLSLSVDSICLHGDNPRAESIARALSLALQKEGVSIL